MAQLEIIMYIALGFATAALLALFIGRLAWLYALRLGRRRAQRSGTPAVAELQGDRDRLRAEQAMMTRRIEVRMDAMKAELAEHMAEVTRHRNRIDHLGEEIARRDAALAQRAAEVARLTEQVGHLEAELASRTEALHQLKDDSRRRDEAYAVLARDLDAARHEIAERDRRMAQLTAEVERLPQSGLDADTGGQTQQRVLSRIEDLSRLSQQIETQRRELTAKQSQYHALRDKIAELRHKDDTEPADTHEPGAQGEAAGSDETVDDAALERHMGDAERHTAEIEKELERLDAEWSAKLAELTAAIGTGAPPRLHDDDAPPEAPEPVPVRSAAGGEDTPAQTNGGDGQGTAAEAANDRKGGAGLANVISLANRIRALHRENDR